MKVDCYVQFRIVLFQHTKQNDLLLKLVLLTADMIKFY